MRCVAIDSTGVSDHRNPRHRLTYDQEAAEMLRHQMGGIYATHFQLSRSASQD